jgi:ribosome-associated protein
MKSTLLPQELVDCIVESAANKKAEKTAVYYTDNESAVADWFIICEGDNIVQNRAIAQAVLDATKQRGARPLATEGYDEGRWILIDYVDIIVHIMLAEMRAYYSLDTLWATKSQKHLRKDRNDGTNDSSLSD